jgi:hypothetical protein
MKTIKNTLIIILFAIFTGISFANGMQPDGSPTSVPDADGIELKSKPEIHYIQLAPVTPREADFEDAKFEESVTQPLPAPNALEPVTPAEADFSE